LPDAPKRIEFIKSGVKPMSAFGGKADIEAKLLTRDEARRIAAHSPPHKADIRSR
jgi:hypothetical protein